MKYLKKALPNLSISLSVSMLVILILDSYNPMMGFLMGTPFQVLTVLTCVSSIATGIVLYASQFKKRRKTPSALAEK